MVLDGSSTPIKVTGCDSEYPLLLEEDPSNRIVNFSGRIMLIKPFQATGKLLYQRWPSLHTAFTGTMRVVFWQACLSS